MTPRYADLVHSLEIGRKQALILRILLRSDTKYNRVPPIERFWHSKAARRVYLRLQEFTVCYSDFDSRTRGYLFGRDIATTQAAIPQAP